MRLLMPCSTMRQTAYSMVFLGSMDTTSRIIASCTLRDRNLHRQTILSIPVKELWSINPVSVIGSGNLFIPRGVSIV
jgi:hypothetical protein